MDGYDAYLQSPAWQQVRRDALARANDHCQICKAADELDVHHNTYAHFGKEWESDVVVLCRVCHELFHRRLQLHAMEHPEDEEYAPLRSDLKQTLSDLEEAHIDDKPVRAVPTGFVRVDQVLGGGLRRGEMSVVASRPSMGKTAFLVGVARNIALYPKRSRPVIFFSADETSETLTERFLLGESRIDSNAAKSGRLRDEDWPRLARAAGRLSETDIHIACRAGMTTDWMHAEAHAVRRRHQDLGAILVDGFELIKTSTSRNRRDQEERDVLAELKVLALELNAPLVLTMPLTRKLEDRGGDKRPMLSDLQAWHTENVADNILFVYRAERYGITVDENGNSTEGLAEILVGKQRNGPIGDVRLAFVHACAKFVNLNSPSRSTHPNPDAPEESSLFGSGFDDPPAL